MTLFLAALPFFYFQAIASITPGPNNIMLTASGMNFGYKRTIPHILGVVFGFLTLILLVSFGIGALYHALPQIEMVMKVVGGAYLVYLSYKIATAGRVGLKAKAKEATKPLTFLQSYAFQFVNPKSIVFCIAAMSILPAEFSTMERTIIITISSLFTSVLSTHVWTIFGKMIAEIFRDDKARHIINIVLALLLLGTIPMMVL